MPYDKDLEFLWLRTSSTIGLLSTQRHFGYLGKDLDVTVRTGQPTVYGLLNSISF
jgi:hypothetical protein